jgi:UDP-GlcNAc:undecaprenyl-phosphate GlcNAc-1-phosphate transferase
MKYGTLAALFALIGSFILTRFARTVAIAVGVLDRPDGVRKLQRGAIPLLGGCAVFAGWVIGIICGYGAESAKESAQILGDSSYSRLLMGICQSARSSLPLMVAALFAVAIGVLDDCLKLRPRWKLLGQIISALIVVAWGSTVNELTLCGYTIELGALSVVFAMTWLVGAMNAINMLDGVDGEASALGLVLSLAVGWIACLGASPSAAIPAMALSGALGGFLAYNLPPARIYLGDAGSMLIGLVLGVLTLQGIPKVPGTLPIAAAIAVMAIPILDGLAAVVRRRLTGRPASTADRRHIHHCLQQHGWSAWQITGGIGMLAATTGVAALASVYSGHDVVAVLATLGVVVMCVSTKLFGYFEWFLVSERLRSLSGMVAAWRRTDHSCVLQTCWRMRTSQSFEELWALLLETASKMRLRRIEWQLYLGKEMRRMSHSFEPTKDLPVWQVALPILAGKSQIGQLNLTGYGQQRQILPQLLGMSIVANALGANCHSLKVESTLLLTHLDNEAAKPRGKCA